MINRSLDLSFSKIRVIENIGHLTKLINLYFVQNKISKIQNLDTLINVTNLELGANRIRVCMLIVVIYFCNLI